MKDLSLKTSLKFLFLPVVFLLAGMEAFAFGQKAPEISAIRSVSSREIQLDTDFSKVGKLLDYRYALFRAEEPLPLLQESGPAELKGKSGLTVPAGTSFISPNGNSYKTDNEYNIGTNGAVSVMLHAEKPAGKTNFLPGQKLAIVPPAAPLQETWTNDHGRITAAFPEAPEKIYIFIKEVSLPQIGPGGRVADTTAEMGKRYSYQIFSAKGTFPEENNPDTPLGGKQYQSIRQKKIPKGILTQKFNTAAVELPLAAKMRISPNEGSVSATVNISFQWNSDIETKNYNYGLYRKSANSNSFNKITVIDFNTPEYQDTVDYNAAYVYQLFYTVPGETAVAAQLPEQLETRPSDKIDSDSIMTVNIKQPPPPVPDPIQTPTQIQAPPQPPPGIYVGIIKFSDNAVEITAQTNTDGSTAGALIPLDTKQRTDALIQQYNSIYTLGSSSTALYHAVHKAIVSIDNNFKGNKLPPDIDSINVVIITDGSDNNSANPSHAFDIEAKDTALEIPYANRIRTNGYSEFLETALKTKINGVSINTWTFGIEGKELDRDELEKVSNPVGEARHIFYGDINELQEELKKIPAELNKRNSKTVLTLIMPAFADNAKINVKYKGESIITGTIKFDGTDIKLTRISAPPQSKYKLATTNDVLGIPEGSDQSGGWSYNIVLNDDLSGAKSDDFEIYREPNINPQTEAAVNPHQEPSINRKSAVVYFVLDSSRSIGEKGIDTVKNTVDKIIRDLFDINIGLGNESEVTATVNENEAAKTVPVSSPAPAPGLYQEADIISRLELGAVYRNWVQITFDQTKSGDNTAVWNIVNIADNDTVTVSSINVARQTKRTRAEMENWFREEAATFWIQKSATGPFAMPGSGIGWVLQAGAYEKLANAVKYWRMLIDNGYQNAQLVKISGGTKDTYKLALPFSSEDEAREFKTRLLSR
jgi:hypothetical protein